MGEIFSKYPKTFPVSAEPLLCGIDRLEASGFSELSGLKVGLITNVAGVSRKAEPDYAVMLRSGVRLKFIMAPEHGFSADIEAGKSVGGSVVHDTLPVFSLYGTSKKPDIRQLKSIDILLFDLQDIGSRCYTYISTMKNAMTTAQGASWSYTGSFPWTSAWRLNFTYSKRDRMAGRFGHSTIRRNRL